MAVCEMGFEHPEPEPVIVEEAVDTEPVAEASVEVARINADRDVAVAKIERKGIDEELIARVAALEAVVEAQRAQMAPQEQEQEAIVVEAPPEPEPEAMPAPEAKEESPEPEKPRKKNAWWG